MNKLIKLLTSIVTTRERLLRSNAKLQTKIELLELELRTLDRRYRQYTLDMAEFTTNNFNAINKWINKHEGSQWKN